LLLTRDQRSSMPDIARLVSQDQVLSADLLRRANSAAYGGSSKVTALNAALARLGMRGIRSFMISQSVKQITLSIGGNKGKSRGESLWHQSLASAYIMAGLADYFKINNEDAFLVGLLHDIGKVVVLRCCHDAEQAVGRPVSDRLFAYICQEYHELMGEMIADRWQLPPEVGQVLARHHGPLDNDDPQAVLKGMVQMTDAILCLLDYAPAVNYDLLQMPAAQFLQVEDRDDFLETLALLPEMVELGVHEMQSV
jgi:putative nucleotidyltransferase with HDIG domain